MIKAKQAVLAMKGYAPPKEGRENKLRLDFNENTKGCSPKVIQALRNIDANKLSVYPEYNAFIKKLAASVGKLPKEVIITNGADDAIRCVMDAYLEKGEEVIIPAPTFDMFRLYALVSEAKITEILYNESNLSFPTGNILKVISLSTKIVVLVNPNNPTGTTIDDKDILKIVKKAQENGSLVIIDEAYYQFFGKSSIDIIKNFRNVVIIRTFSKAYGLAGLRLGYIVSNKDIIRNIMKSSSPYSVNSIAVIAGSAALDDPKYVEAYAEEVNKNKEFLIKELTSLGLKVFPSGANFIVAYFGNRCSKICEELKKDGILVRNRTKDPLLKNCIRITVGTEEQCKQLIEAIKKILPKDTLLFDLDGVLADVNNSYRVAIKKTSEFFTGEKITDNKVQKLKEEGGFNNDWKLTQELIKRKGKNVDFETVKDKFQECYLGNGFDGLIQDEPLLLPKERLQNLKKRYLLGIVTGRPREEAEFFLKNNGIRGLFSVVICKEDSGTKEKPDPYGIELAKEKLKIDNAYYLGDSVDDITAAIKAGIRPIGIIPPGLEDKKRLKDALKDKGAQKVLDNINEIEEYLKRSNVEVRR